MPAWAGDWNNLTLNDFKCRYGFSSTDVSLPANASQLSSSILKQKAIMRRLWFSSQHYRITRVVHSTPICWTKIPLILTNAPTNSLHTAQVYEILSDDNSGQEIFKVLKIWKYRRFDLRHASLSIFDFLHLKTNTILFTQRMKAIFPWTLFNEQDFYILCEFCKFHLYHHRSVYLPFPST